MVVVVVLEGVVETSVKWPELRRSPRRQVQARYSRCLILSIYSALEIAAW